MQKYDVELIVWVQVKDQSTSGIAFASGEFGKDFCWHLNNVIFHYLASPSLQPHWFPLLSFLSSL